MKHYAFYSSGDEAVSDYLHALRPALADESIEHLLADGDYYDDSFSFAGAVLREKNAEKGGYSLLDENKNRLLAGFDLLRPICLEPLKYRLPMYKNAEDIRSFLACFQEENPYLLAEKEEKFGVYGADGELLVPPVFDDVIAFAPAIFSSDPDQIGGRERYTVRMFLCFLNDLEKSMEEPLVRALFAEDFLSEQQKYREKGKPLTAAVAFNTQGELILTNLAHLTLGSYVVLHADPENPMNISDLCYRSLFAYEHQPRTVAMEIPLRSLFPTGAQWWHHVCDDRTDYERRSLSRRARFEPQLPAHKMVRAVIDPSLDEE